MQTKVKGMNGILMIAVLLIVFLFPLDVSAAETASAALVGYYEDVCRGVSQISGCSFLLF